MANEERAAEAFGVLADPTRIAILRAFAEALDGVDPEDPDPAPTLSFSTVYDRVDVDSTSKLSYHLKKLDGTYLRHADDGWRITFAGVAVVRLVLSGAYAGGIDFEPLEVEGRCFHCDAEALRVVVDDLLLCRECTDCGRRMGGVPVTPAQLRGRDEESLLESTRTRLITHFRRFRKNVCPECGGTVDVDFRTLSGPGNDGDLVVIGRCRHCWKSINGPPAAWLSSHPATIAFHRDHGVDVLSFGLREMVERHAAGDWRTERVDRGEYACTYRIDSATLRLVIDDDLSVLAAERVRRDPAG